MQGIKFMFVCFSHIINKVKYVLEIFYDEAPDKCFKINKAKFISTCSYSLESNKEYAKSVIVCIWIGKLLLF